MNIKKLILLSIVFAVTIMLVSGCECPAKKTAMKSEKNPCETAMMSTTSQKFSTGGGTCGAAVMLEKMTPSQVVNNQPFDYRIKVTNLTDRELRNVMVKDQIPSNLVFKSSTPDMIASPAGQVAWSLGTLEPKASQTINATAVASGTGTLTSCAEVSYETAICANISIVEPKLALTKSAPSETLVCDRIPLEYVITNNGSGVACGITIEDQLPEGMVTSDGSGKIVFNVPSVMAGQSERFHATVDASKPGKYTSKAIATSGFGNVESDATTTVLSQPVLAINETGPEKEYIGRPVTYQITVTNSGDGIAKDTVAEAWLPDGVKFESATEDGKYTHMSPGKVTWHLGELGPSSTKKISVTFMPDQQGSLSTKAVAKAYCAESVSQSAQTVVVGIAAILLEVVDVADPIPVGQNETYVITVTNQGSATDTNIHIICVLEPGMEYVSSSGPTTGTFAGNQIDFAPLASLAAKDKTSWEIVVKAASAGDMRFKAMLTSSQLTRPVEETEATNFYK